MTLEELLQTPLMRRAKVVAGASGLSREVTWCVQDSALKFENAIMPGLLLLVARHDEPGFSLSDFLDRIEETLMAGVAFFEGDVREGELESATALETYAEYDRRAIPLIMLPKGTNAITFMKRFVSAYSTYYSEQYRREEWLHEICYGSGLAGGETLARAYGYNPDYQYHCTILTIREAGEIDPIVREMEADGVKAFLKKAFSAPDARVLSYVSQRHVVCFVPWKPSDSTQDLRRRMVATITDMRHTLTSLKWQVVVGSCARTLAEFHDSYLGALRTQEVIEMLDVHEKVSFYDDWYMHMLLLKEPRAELREHMSHTLAPILDSPDLLETLTNYLVFGENLKETAEKTFIHVNTLKYRLKRIQELLGVDLRDPNARFRLRMAITIERYLRE